MSCTIADEKCGGLCTGYDGSHIWKKRMEITKEIECETCRDEAIKLETFSHDIVNGRLGKPIYDRENFHEYVKIVNCVAASCRADGRC